MKQEIKGLKFHHVVFGWVIVGLVFYIMWSCQQDNMTDYKGGQSECRKEYLGE